MTATACPVCGFASFSAQQPCPECGWDYPVLLGDEASAHDYTQQQLAHHISFEVACRIFD